MWGAITGEGCGGVWRWELNLSSGLYPYHPFTVSTVVSGGSRSTV